MTDELEQPDDAAREALALKNRESLEAMYCEMQPEEALAIVREFVRLARHNHGIREIIVNALDRFRMELKVAEAKMLKGKANGLNRTDKKHSKRHA